MKNWKEKARACASWWHGASARGRRRGQRADKVPTSSVAWPTRIRSEAHAPLSSRFLTFRDCAHLSTSGSGRNFFFQRQPTNRWIVRSSACGHFTGLTFGIRVSNWTIQVCHLFQFFNWILLGKCFFKENYVTVATAHFCSQTKKSALIGCQWMAAEWKKEINERQLSELMSEETKNCAAKCVWSFSQSPVTQQWPSLGLGFFPLFFLSPEMLGPPRGGGLPIRFRCNRNTNFWQDVRFS